MTYVPLHIHSQYSILDSTVSIKKLAKMAKEYGFNALGLTDSGNLYGAVEFYQACVALDIKPILGCELRLAPEGRKDKKRIPGMPSSFPFVAIATNQTGYRNLCKLSSFGYLEGFYYYPRVDKELLEKYHEGLIILSGSVHSEIGHYLLNKEDQVDGIISWYQDLFKDRFYFELQRHAMTDAQVENDNLSNESWVLQRHEDLKKKEVAVNDFLIKTSKEKSIPLVATNQVHYLQREDYKAHEILLNVQSGEPCEIWQRDSQGKPQLRIPNPKRKIYSSHEHYFKTKNEIESLFSDQKEALENTAKIADLCDWKLDFKTKHYPVYTPPTMETSSLSRKEESERYFKQLCEEGIPKRYTPEKLKKVEAKYPGKDPLTVVRDRLAYELDLIISKGMCDYLLIVFDFINWAKTHRIPVGPGRGSAAGSIIAYLIGITDIEPLRFSLFFERFINPERISYPDIDVDICMDRRSEVIDYTVQKYGKEKVAQIITFGKMKAKMAIKDVGRVLSVALSKVNTIAKLVPEDPNMTLEKALEIDHEFKSLFETDPEAKMIVEMARRTEGSIRNTSIHAAGLIICKDTITDHIPVCNAKDSDMCVTQFAMKPVEAVGMLKIDFLGLKTLTSIQKAVDALDKKGIKVDWENLPLDDHVTFDLLNQGKTLGVFQLESGGMQELARQLHIDHFEEIIAVGALYRPGPMDMIPSFIARKHKKEPIVFDHPLMKEILEETYGVMVYQEQVMQIAQKLAGYSLGEGDVLRKAMGKKDQEEMERQRKKFLEGAKQNDIDEKTSTLIFDKIQKFASYGFNKSHATAYAYLSYTTAYLKANHPMEWMASLMTCDRDDLTKVAKFIRECHALNIKILPPDINKAGLEFSAVEDGIYFALSAVKGVGEACVEAICEERDKNGLFSSFYEFICRVDKKKVTKKNIENLADAGCFNFEGWSKDALKQSLDMMYDKASREQKEKDKGILNLFSLIEGHDENQFATAPKVVNPTSELEILQKEKELLGFYLSGHPLESFQEEVEKLSCDKMAEINEDFEQKAFRFAFVLESVQVKISQRNGQKFAILLIGEGLDRYEVPIWSDLYNRKAHLLEENRLLCGVFLVDKKDGFKLSCHHLEDLKDLDEDKTKEFLDVYNRIVDRQKRGDFKKKKPKVEKKMEQKILMMKLCTKKASLSHVLKLKKLIRKYPGSHDMEIIFSENRKKLGHLKVDSKWKIQPSDDFKQDLSKIGSIIELEEKVVKDS